MNKTIKPINVARLWFIRQIPVDVATESRVDSLARLIDSERAAERERCAKVAESCNDAYDFDAKVIAAAIRALK